MFSSIILTATKLKKKTSKPIENDFREFKSTQIQTICCGNKHLLFLLKDGSVHAYGNNKNGQLGVVGKEVVGSLHTLKFPKGEEEKRRRDH